MYNIFGNLQTFHISWRIRGPCSCRNLQIIWLIWTPKLVDPLQQKKQISCYRKLLSCTITMHLMGQPCSFDQEQLHRRNLIYRSPQFTQNARKNCVLNITFVLDHVVVKDFLVDVEFIVIWRWHQLLGKLLNCKWHNKYSINIDACELFKVANSSFFACAPCVRFACRTG